MKKQRRTNDDIKVLCVLNEFFIYRRKRERNLEREGKEKTRIINANVPIYIYATFSLYVVKLLNL